MKICIKCKREYPDNNRKLCDCGGVLLYKDPVHIVPAPPEPPVPRKQNLKVIWSREYQSVAKRQGVADELLCGKNITYVLRDNDAFYETKYNAMLSNKLCVECMKMAFNGKTQLFYKTEGKRSILQILENFVSEDEFCELIKSVLSAVIQIKNHGHISCGDIDFSLQRVFIDGPDNRVQFICLPLREGKKLWQEYDNFEKIIRDELITLIDSSICSDNSRGHTVPQIAQLNDSLSDPTNSLEMVYTKARNSLRGSEGNLE